MKKIGIIFIVLGILIFIILMFLLLQIDTSVCSVDMRKDLLAFCRIGAITTENNLLLISTVFIPAIFLGIGTFICIEIEVGE